MSSSEATEAAAVDAAIARYGQQPGPLLVVLHGVQDALGYIPPASIPRIAEAKKQIIERSGVLEYFAADERMAE